MLRPVLALVSTKKAPWISFRKNEACSFFTSLRYLSISPLAATRNITTSSCAYSFTSALQDCSC